MVGADKGCRSHLSWIQQETGYVGQPRLWVEDLPWKSGQWGYQGEEAMGLLSLGHALIPLQSQGCRMCVLLPTESRTASC